MPSAWKLTQLLGKTASGRGGSGVSSPTQTRTPSASSARAQRVELGQRRAMPGRRRRPAVGSAVGWWRRVRVEAEPRRPDHQHPVRALRAALLPARGHVHPPRHRGRAGTLSRRAADWVQNARAMPDTVPTLSFAEVHAADFPSRIGAAFERYGFVIITDHGIPQPLIERFLGLYQRFFALPEAEKRRYHVAGGGGARGYTPFGIETAKGATHHDLKEFWHVGRELPDGHRVPSSHAAERLDRQPAGIPRPDARDVRVVRPHGPAPAGADRARAVAAAGLFRGQGPARKQRAAGDPLSADAAGPRPKACAPARTRTST